MKEKLLQFIWQHQYFNKNNLQTFSGDTLLILEPGIPNINQGPDFLQAKIKINNTTWVGNIEIHILSSGWYLHKHDKDVHFNNVILHVVWEMDKQVTELSGKQLPTLILQDRIPKLLLAKYDSLKENTGFIPCDKHIRSVNDLVLSGWLQRLMIERLQQRSVRIYGLLKENNNHWEETFWWMLAANLGMKINGQSFEQMARSLPLTIIAKHKHQIQQIEALLFGQAGLLNNDFNEQYPLLLKKEYSFLQSKYSLRKIDTPVFFLRMRPANFPTIRLAQLAVLVCNSHHLFSKIIEIEELNDVKILLNVSANDYWHYHYNFDSPGDYKVKNMGEQMLDNIIINTIVPILFAYGEYANDRKTIDKALRWLEQIPAENNSITKTFKILGIDNKNASQSQSLIQLKNQYCSLKKCLKCAIGNAIIKGEKLNIINPSYR